MRARREIRAAAPDVYGFVSRKTRNCLSVRRMGPDGLVDDGRDPPRKPRDTYRA
jgi:hypothetical protein